MFRGRKRKFPFFFVPTQSSDEEIQEEVGDPQQEQDDEPILEGLRHPLRQEDARRVQYVPRHPNVQRQEEQNIVVIVPHEEEEEEEEVFHQHGEPPQERPEHEQHVGQPHEHGGDEDGHDGDQQNHEGEGGEDVPNQRPLQLRIQDGAHARVQHGDQPMGDSSGEESDESEHELPLENDYVTLLENFSEKWVSMELDHTVSKIASDDFWRLACEFLPKIVYARSAQNVTRKLPQFSHIRKKLYNDNVPEVTLEIGYKNKDTDEVTVVTDTITPIKQYPPNQFEKMFEIASVKVTKNRIILIFPGFLYFVSFSVRPSVCLSVCLYVCLKVTACIDENNALVEFDKIS